MISFLTSDKGNIQIISFCRYCMKPYLVKPYLVKTYLVNLVPVRYGFVQKLSQIITIISAFTEATIKAMTVNPCNAE